MLSDLLAAKKAESCPRISQYKDPSFWGTSKWGCSALQKRLSAAIRQQLRGLDPASGEGSGKRVGTRLGLRRAGWNEGRKSLRKVTSWAMACSCLVCSWLWLSIS